jgi:hypothetical protein
MVQALRAIWQFMDRDVTHKISYGPKRSWVPYTIVWVTDRSINCHLARRDQQTIHFTILHTNDFRFVFIPQLFVGSIISYLCYCVLVRCNNSLLFASTSVYVRSLVGPMLLIHDCPFGYIHVTPSSCDNILTGMNCTF